MTYTIHGRYESNFEPLADVFLQQLPKSPRKGGQALTVYHRGVPVVDIWSGVRDKAGAPWQADTMSISYSTTKGVLSTLAHMLVDEGVLAYDTPIARWWPEFAAMTGLDLSSDMLLRARRKLAAHPARITLIQWRYDQPLNPRPTFDLVVFSYCLSMINPGWEQAMEAALRDLRPGGRLAVVDFHDTRFAGFRHWMGINHVRMDGHLLPRLNVLCSPVEQIVRDAYGGGWRYFRFIGQKPGN